VLLIQAEQIIQPQAQHFKIQVVEEEGVGLIHLLSQAHQAALES
jgi:hypothetical protein